MNLFRLFRALRYRAALRYAKYEHHCSLIDYEWSKRQREVAIDNLDAAIRRLHLAEQAMINVDYPVRTGRGRVWWIWGRG